MTPKQPKSIYDLKLTEEEIDTVESFKQLAPEAKQELIDLVHVLSQVLYSQYHEKTEGT